MLEGSCDMDNSNEQNNRGKVDFEELLKRIEQEQKGNPETPSIQEEKTEPVPVEEEDVPVLPKRKQEFVINIKDDEFESTSDEDFVRVDKFTKARAIPVNTEDAEDEFATRNIDVEKELQKQAPERQSTLSSLIYVAGVLLASILLSIKALCISSNFCFSTSLNAS